jgi:tRNA(His) guanylyltransferase
MDKTSLGDRIKGYEGVSRNFLVGRMPVICRVDGRAFHTFTKHCEKPFDKNIISAMVHGAKQVADDMQGFKVGYVQSDEASFVITDYDEINTQGWFNYNLSKMISMSASVMTLHFNSYYRYLDENIVVNGSAVTRLRPIPNGYFDSRAFNVPREDVSNYLLWRCQDWKRNSLQMYARSVYSHKALMNKNQDDMHELLHQKGKNWATDLSNVEKNGTFLVKTDDGIGTRSDIRPSFEEISAVVEPLVYPLEKLEK